MVTSSRNQFEYVVICTVELGTHSAQLRRAETVFVSFIGLYIRPVAGRQLV